LKGKCGECEYRETCGGCRGRAYACAGDYLAADTKSLPIYHKVLWMVCGMNLKVNPLLD
jgi:hypothetical protein